MLVLKEKAPYSKTLIFDIVGILNQLICDCKLVNVCSKLCILLIPGYFLQTASHHNEIRASNENLWISRPLTYCLAKLPGPFKIRPIPVSNDPTRMRDRSDYAQNVWGE